MKRDSERAFIVDASIALKWFLPPGDEPDYEKALELPGRLNLRSTSLAYYEAGNILMRAPDSTSEWVGASLRAMRDICGPPIDLVNEDLDACSLIAAEHQITFCDASYVAIARRLGRRVLSADSDLLGPGLAVGLDDAINALP